MHDFTPFYSPFAPGLMVALMPFLVLAAIWTIVLKGFALWYTARGSQKWWFVALLVINTLGVLEIIYLIWFRRDSGAPHTHHPHEHLHHHDAPEHRSASQA